MSLSVVMEDLYTDGRYVTWNGSACVGFNPDGSPMESYMVGTNQLCEPASGGEAGQTINCGAACTVTIRHAFEHPTTAAPLTASMVSDYMELWYAFLLVAVVVLCAKAIYNRFRMDYEH